MVLDKERGKKKINLSTSQFCFNELHRIEKYSFLVIIKISV